MLTEPERSSPRLRFVWLFGVSMTATRAKHGGVDGVPTSAFATQAALDARTRGAFAVSMSAHRAGALAAAVTFCVLLFGVSLTATRAKHGVVDGVLPSAFATQAALDARTRRRATRPRARGRGTIKDLAMKTHAPIRVTGDGALYPSLKSSGLVLRISATSCHVCSPVFLRLLEPLSVHVLPVR